MILATTSIVLLNAKLRHQNYQADDHSKNINESHAIHKNATHKTFCVGDKMAYLLAQNKKEQNTELPPALLLHL